MNNSCVPDVHARSDSTLINTVNALLDQTGKLDKTEIRGGYNPCPMIWYKGTSQENYGYGQWSWSRGVQKCIELLSVFKLWFVTNYFLEAANRSLEITSCQRSKELHTNAMAHGSCNVCRMCAKLFSFWFPASQFAARFLLLCSQARSGLICQIPLCRRFSLGRCGSQEGGRWSAAKSLEDAEHSHNQNQIIRATELHHNQSWYNQMISQVKRRPQYKKTFSFGHCPNNLFLPPSPHFGQRCTFSKSKTMF